MLDSLRVPGDFASEASAGSGSAAVDRFLFNDLLVQDSVVPRLARQIDDVISKLGLDASRFLVFVYASPFVQAECHIDKYERCVLRLSSCLVESFTEEELNFVLGHEIGHYVFKHHLVGGEPGSSSIEGMMLSRRRELSADRVGLLACQSLSAALSAMLKSVSGLSERNLRIDIAAFISQLRSQSPDSAGAENRGSHPAFVIRCRALLWFSMVSYSHVSDGCDVDRGGLELANSRIVSDLEKYVDASAIEFIRDAKSEAMFWNKARDLVKAGVFSASDQRAFEADYGVERTDQLKGLLLSLTRSEAQEELEMRHRNCLEEFRTIAPFSFSIEFPNFV